MASSLCYVQWVFPHFIRVFVAFCHQQALKHLHSLAVSHRMQQAVHCLSKSVTAVLSISLVASLRSLCSSWLSYFVVMQGRICKRSMNDGSPKPSTSNTWTPPSKMSKSCPYQAAAWQRCSPSHFSSTFLSIQHARKLVVETPVVHVSSNECSKIQIGSAHERALTASMEAKNTYESVGARGSCCFTAMSD